VIPFVLAGFMVLFIVTSTIGFIIWAMREHSDAVKYRELVRLARNQQNAAHISNVQAGNRWEVTYKEKGKMLKLALGAETEAEAIKKAIKINPSIFTKIVEVRKF